MTHDDIFHAIPRPPPCAQHLGSDDPDEVSSWVARRDGDHSRVVHGSGPYGFRLARIETATVQMAWARTRLGNTLQARFRVPTFHVPVGPIQRYAFGRRRFEAAAGRVVFIAPETDVTRRSDGGPLMAIEVDAATLAAELRMRHGTDRVEWPRAPQLLALAEPQKRDLIGALDALVRAHHPGAAATGRVHGESRLLAALAGALPRSSGGSIPLVSVQRLKHLEDWIDAHVGEAITLGRLCAVAQIGERSLQTAFQARRGMSPMRFVCERRLAEAQRRLYRSGPDEDVTAIATRLGFMHLGRFASAYCAAFGESPSHTLARGRGSSRSRNVAAAACSDGNP